MADDKEGKGRVILDGGIIGKDVQWVKRGRGAGEVAQGTVLAHVHPGITNDEAFNKLKRHRPYDFVYRPSYREFDDATHTTERVFVAVERTTSTGRTKCHFYAPNIADVFTV